MLITIFSGLEAAPLRAPSLQHFCKCIGVVAPRDGGNSGAVVGNPRDQSKQSPSGLRSLQQFRAGLVQAWPKKRFSWFAVKIAVVRLI